MPRPKKPAGTTADKRNGQRADLSVVGNARVERFDPPTGLCEEASVAWEEFWADRPALLLTPSATVVLRRWIIALNRYWITTAEADDDPLLTGSTGQQVANPLYKIAEQALRTVEACEKQLGIGGLNASSLGLAAIQERRSLADMNARYGGSGGSSDSEETPEDPRLTVIDAG